MNYLFKTCVGQVGIQPEIFWEFSFAEVVLVILGFTELQNAREEAQWKRVDFLNQEQWNSARWSTAALMSSFGGESVDPKKLLKLPWDAEESEELIVENLMTKEELETCANAWGIDLEKYEW
ncbi:hypothetical protein [Marinifilum flexuosum]|uniref:Uncharacterized protein n=1 Tax=Marinifilum flexuosum TaxID=1117708 RepID=A0A419WN15_9BACT|nr:hypothetical protein [Marinifilum flexuosum]RKD96786.1 hypothetical protein BXY64_3733 [Marinifilum flexuosum]